MENRLRDVSSSLTGLTLARFLASIIISINFKVMTLSLSLMESMIFQPSTWLPSRRKLLFYDSHKVSFTAAAKKLLNYFFFRFPFLPYTRCIFNASENPLHGHNLFRNDGVFEHFDFYTWYCRYFIFTMVLLYSIKPQLFTLFCGLLCVRF